MFGPKRVEERTGESCTMTSFVFYTRHRILNKGRLRRRWAGHVTRMGEMRNTQFWLKSLKRGDHLDDLRVDRRIILKPILNK
jgi:hypothetical protein